jgi:hypothetical protein
MEEKENNHEKPATSTEMVQSRIALAIRRQSAMDRVRTDVRAYLAQSRQERQELSKKRFHTQGRWAMFRQQVQAKLQEIKTEGRKARQSYKQQKAAAAASGGDASGNASQQS